VNSIISQDGYLNRTSLKTGNMSKHEPFRFKSAEELLKKAEELGITLPLQKSLDPLFEPLRLGEKNIPNRLVVQPMEGFDANPDGSPGELTLRRYTRYAEGGSGMIWFEATAVVTEGRSNPRQLVITKQSLPGFQRLIQNIRSSALKSFGASHNLYLVLQLTHSGRFSKPDGIPRPWIFSGNPYLKSGEGENDLLTDVQIERLQEKFIEAGILAEKAGFDGVDIKASHGYLLHEFLSSFSRKGSRFGGSSFEDRTRFLMEVIRGIKSKTSNIGTCSRINLYDGIPYPYGFGMKKDGTYEMDLEEPMKLVEQLKQSGCYLINGTMGVPYLNAHINRPFDTPLPGMKYPDEHPLEGVARLINGVGIVQQANPGAKFVGTGYSWFRHLFPEIAAGVLALKKATLIGLGRSSFAYPNAPKDLMQYGKMKKNRTCTSCSKCTELMRHMLITGCPVRDKETYGPIYKRIMK